MAVIAGSAAGCASTKATTAAPEFLGESPQAEDAVLHTKPWTHAATGMVFPASIAGFSRDDREPRDPRSDGAAVNYKLLGDEVAVMVTVYIYPQSQSGDDLDRHFLASKTAVLRNGRGTELLAEGPMELDQDGDIQSGRRAHFIISNDNEPYPPQITHLFLFKHGPWFIKYRTIFLAFQHEMADVANLELMRALSWPTADRGRLAEGPRFDMRAVWATAKNTTAN